MALSIDTIYGVGVGVEFLTQELCQQAMDDPEAKWGFIIELFAIRLIFIKF